VIKVIYIRDPNTDENESKMPALKDKSEQSRSAFELLYKNELYASSVHCIYYHCLQFSKHVLHTYCGVNYQAQEDRSRGRGSHDSVREMIEDDLKNVGLLIVSNDFNCYFTALKRLRKKADYTGKRITGSMAKDALGFSESLDGILKDHYVNKKIKDEPGKLHHRNDE
jgi:uncharacterized protein (UPF0332 family)